MNKIYLFCLTLTVLLFNFVAPSSASAAVSSWQKSAHVLPTSTDSYSSAHFQAAVAQLAQTGANHLTLVIPYYQDNLYSSSLYPGWNTPTDTALASAIDYAHSQGMAVTLKIHADSNTGEWRAYINPSDRSAWFNSYTNLLNRYADFAQAHGVEQFCLGAELYSVTSPSVNSGNTTAWQAMIAAVRQRFSGQLTYSAQHTNPDEVNQIEFWDRLDSIGLAGYYPLAANLDNPSVDDLVASWQYWDQSVLSPLSTRWQKPLNFTEIGYRSVAGAHKQPWSWSLSGPVDEAEQARDYDAFFTYWQDKSYVVGVHWWLWEDQVSAGGPSSTSYTPQNKQAQSTLAQWFGSSAPQPSPSESPAPTVSPSPEPTAEPSILPSPEPSPTASPTGQPVNPRLPRIPTITIPPLPTVHLPVSSWPTSRPLPRVPTPPRFPVP